MAPRKRQAAFLCQRCGARGFDFPHRAPKRKYCSHTCAMTAQNQDPVFKERARVGSRRAGVSAHRKDREAYFARVRAFLINSLGTLPPAVPSQDVLRIAAKIYRHAYNLGYHVGYNREWRQAHPNYWLRRDDV